MSAFGGKADMAQTSQSAFDPKRTYIVLPLPTINPAADIPAAIYLMEVVAPRR